MRSKKLIFFILIIFFILFINSSCFAINVTVDNSTVQLPDFNNEENYFIFKDNSNNNFYLYSLNSGAEVYYQEDDNRLQVLNVTIYHYIINSDTQWVYERSLAIRANLYLDSRTLLYSTFDILYQNSDRIFFANTVNIPEPEPDTNNFIDTLYIGDIPLEFCYAQFNSDYVTLYNQSSANNEELPYYRIYFIENYFAYETGFTTFDTSVNFTKINVTNNFFYRRDFVNICLTTFIIILFFLFVTNLFTSIIYKGGVLRGLL